MFNVLRIRVGGFLNRLVTMFHRADDGPETIINELCNAFEADIDRLGVAVDALDARREDNLTLIKELDEENLTFEKQATRAHKLRTGLDKLLNGVD